MLSQFHCVDCGNLKVKLYKFISFYADAFVKFKLIDVSIASIHQNMVRFNPLQ